MKLNLPVNSNYIIIVIRCEQYDKIISTMSVREKNALTFAVNNVVDELVNKEYNGYSVDMGKGEFLAIIQSAEPIIEDRIKKLSTNIKSALKSALKLKAVLGVGCCVKNLYNIGESYGDACLKINDYSEQFVDIVEDYIYTNYMHSIKIDEIAQMVYATPTYLCYKFKKARGVTINEYITGVRIKAAKRILSENSGIRIADVANCVGYNDAVYFSRLFKKHTGLNPSEWRKTIEEPNSVQSLN